MGNTPCYTNVDGVCDVTEERYVEDSMVYGGAVHANPLRLYVAGGHLAYLASQ
jgi:hypothetical protein